MKPAVAWLQRNEKNLKIGGSNPIIVIMNQKNRICGESKESKAWKISRISKD